MLGTNPSSKSAPAPGKDGKPPKPPSAAEQAWMKRDRPTMDKETSTVYATKSFAGTAPHQARLLKAALEEEVFAPDPSLSIHQKQWGNKGPARAATAMRVAGPIGASYTVFETNWKCADCDGENYASKKRCARCRAPRPEFAPAEEGGAEGGGGGALGAPAAAHDWVETFDPVTKVGF